MSEHTGPDNERAHRTLAHLVGVLAPSRHDSILLKDRSLHRTRGGSPTRGRPTTVGSTK